jgi:hypothetical protein
MKRILAGILLVIGVALFIGTDANAQDEDFGIGFMVGEPTGLAAKKWIGGKSAFAGGAAWSFVNNSAMVLHLDYLHHNYEAFNVRVEKGKLPFYMGIGGRIKLDDESRLGARVPIGVVYVSDEYPLDVFFEVVPLLDLVPETSFTVNGGIGLRYYF